MSRQSHIVSAACMYVYIIYVTSLKGTTQYSVKEGSKFEGYIADVLDSLNEFVPVQCCSGGMNELLISQMVFGNQLTVAQTHGAAIMRSSDLNVQKQLN